MRSRKKKGAGIFINRQLVAWFADPNRAHEYAQEYYFGQWLMFPHKIPVVPQIKITKRDRRKARELHKIFENDNR